MTSFVGTQAALDLKSTNNIALYWGQNSYNAASGNLEQQPLAYYCQNSDIDVLQLSFLTNINGIGGVPEINLANIGDNCTTFNDTNLLNCPQVGYVYSCWGIPCDIEQYKTKAC